MKILGLSFFYHDSAACLLVDGKPVAMAEEERFSRKKHDADWPVLAVAFALAEAKITAQDLDYVVFYEKPFLKLDRFLKTVLGTFPFGPLAWGSGIKQEMEKKLWIRQLISDKLDISPDKVLFSGHHFSHAASAFFPSPFERSAILTIDGVGEWATTTLALGEGKVITPLKEIRFPHSLGLLYSAFTAFLGFEVNEGEYKVMGMAPYGSPKYADKVRKLLRVKDDGSFELDGSYFCFDRSLTRTYTRKFVELFGEPRDPASKFFTRTTGWPSYFGPKASEEEHAKLAERQEYYADIAASVQAVLEERVIALADELHRLTKADALCLAGGVALNSVANWKIIQKTGFKRMFIQPAAGDAGGAYGAALAVHHAGLGQAERHRFEHAAYGKSFTDEEVGKALAEVDVKSVRHDDATLLPLIARELADGKVIGWFSGRFEWGPRALGSRSILADPRRREMKDLVNVKIKFREPYRPFAPSVLAERAGDYFDMPDALEHLPARFMLYVVPVRPERRDEVPAITHVDGSARPQVVVREHTPRYHALISEFAKITGTPMVMNTSFNLKGEPIVTSPLDALKTFAKSGMDSVVLEHHLVRREDLPESFLRSVAAGASSASVGKSVASRVLTGLAIALVSLIVTFLVLEVGVRHFSKPIFPILRADPDVGTIHEKNVARLIWNDESGRETFVRTNGQGYIGRDVPLPKPAGTYRAAFLGDSMTEGIQVDADRNFVYLLEQSLNVSRGGRGKRAEFMNYGVGGTGTFLQYEIYLKKIAPYKPDLVVLMFHENDYGDNMNKINFDPDHYKETTNRNTALKSLLLKSELFKFLFTKLQFNVTFLKFLNALGLYEFNNYTQKTVESWWGASEQDPRFYSFTFDLVKKLNDRVRADGGRLVVVAMVQPEPYWADLQKDPKTYDKHLEKFLAGEKIEFVNPIKSLWDAKQKAGACLTIQCGGHLNETGHEAMAGALYPYFLDQLKDAGPKTK